jgi:alpha-tubulin suppressor-like RCC1 family protein
LGRSAGSGGAATGVVPLTGVIDIAAGAHHALALTGGGQVYAWGRQYDGQLGLAASADRNTPQLITSLSDVTKIAAGTLHSMALRSNGQLYVWGSHTCGQLGLGHVDYSNTTLPTPLLALTNVTDIAAGGYHSLALVNGSLWAWGDNTWGQLGTGLTEDSSVPRLVSLNGSALTGVTSVSAGERHSLAVTTDGRIRLWGDDAHGQLGDGSDVYSETPIRPVTLRQSVVQVSGGGGHTLVLDSSGHVWSWGANYDGQLGRLGDKDACRPARVFAPAQP